MRELTLHANNVVNSIVDDVTEIAKYVKGKIIAVIDGKKLGSQQEKK